MSMNLYFSTKSEPCYPIDFPFQTPTKLTYDVMAEKDNVKRLELIRQHMVTSNWKQEDIDITMKQVEALINSPNLELSYM